MDNFETAVAGGSSFLVVAIDMDVAVNSKNDHRHAFFRWCDTVVIDVLFCDDGECFVPSNLGEAPLYCMAYVSRCRPTPRAQYWW